MLTQFSRLVAISLVLGVCLVSAENMYSQQSPAAQTQPPPEADLPPVPKGVDVLARGPVHEAFATPTVDPKPAPLCPKQPPAPLEEMAPEERPDGNVVWIGGYWAWDDEARDFLWVSGCWRSPPPGKEWVAGYWRETGGQWQWVSGFWANARQENRPAEVTYYPEPPPPPQVAAPPPAPAADMIYVPGYWTWVDTRYAWRAGYWRRPRPGFVWVTPCYRWSPCGYVYVPGYWDMAIADRGVLYAPVSINFAICGPRFAYTPCYAVCDTIILDSLFVRPAFGCYYFGDYYGGAYVGLGFQSCFVFGRRYYDPIISYQGWVNRGNPAWLSVQINLFNSRSAGLAPRPPRTLVQQNTVINNVTNITNINNTKITNINSNNKNVTVSNTRVLAPTRVVAGNRGQKVVQVAAAERAQVRNESLAVQQAAAQQRIKAEASPAPKGSQPRVSSFNLPPVTPRPGTNAAKGDPNPIRPAATAAPKGNVAPKTNNPPPKGGNPGAIKPIPQPKGPATIPQPLPKGPTGPGAGQPGLKVGNPPKGPNAPKVIDRPRGPGKNGSPKVGERSSAPTYAAAKVSDVPASRAVTSSMTIGARPSAERRPAVHGASRPPARTEPNRRGFEKKGR